MPETVVRGEPREGGVPGDVVEADLREETVMEETVGEVTLPRESLEKILKSQGQDALAAALAGEEYTPTFFQSVKSRVIRGTDTLLSLAVVAVPGLGLSWLIYQGIRLAIPAARDWPSLGIKYSRQEALPAGGARARRIA